MDEKGKCNFFILIISVMHGSCKMHGEGNNSLFIIPSGNNNNSSHKQHVKARLQKAVGIEI